MNLRIIFLLFIIYSFIGWLMEIAVVSIQENKLKDRGFLIGPVCPIYGIGALGMTLLLSKYYNDIFALFIMSVVLGAILEYFVSYILEKIFHTRWWDYSNYKYNLNGRICLINCIAFGFLGVILIRYLNPFFIYHLTLMPNMLLLIFAIIFFVIFMTDTIISFKVISKVKIVNSKQIKDTTDEMTKEVRKFLKEHSIFTKRLLMSFPNLEVILHNKNK